MDSDGDGYNWPYDCDDTNSSFHPDAQEILNDGLDQNCNGVSEEWNLTLRDGWNLASLPMNFSVDCITLSSYLDYEVIYQLNASKDGYDGCINGMQEFSNLEFDSSKPFWIKMNVPYTLQENWILNDAHTLDLQKGWNLVQYPLIEEVAITDAFANAPDVTHVYEFENGDWVLWRRDTPINPLEKIKPDHGYWVFSEIEQQIDIQ